MQYEIEIDGRKWQVAVMRVGDRFSVTVDGRTSHVNAARIDAYTLSLLIEPSPNRIPDIGGSREVTIAPDPITRQLTVRVGTMPIAVSLNGRRHWGRKDDGGHAASGPQRIVAPMPGKVVRVLVQPGDPVRARQGLVVIEAMKMENELRAARDGTVTEVQVREAASVEAGALLVVIA
jgi:biotin carboxyl carrier protein